MSRRGGPTFIDLFCGCGGLTRGFTDSGFRLRGAVDSDLAAAATFAANFGVERVVWGPINRLIDVPSVDVVVGGPPCQGFSSLGKRDPSDRRNRLWREYARVVRASGCSVFVLENVDRFGRSEEMRSLTRATRRGGLLEGFTLEHYLLNAADYGTPQRRVRTVLIGSRVGPVGPPAATHSRDGTVLDPWRTVWDAIEELPYHPYDQWPDSTTDAWGEDVPGPFKLDDLHVARHYTDTSLARFRAIPPGGNRFDLPEELKAECWKKHTTGATDVMGRLAWDKPAVTIRTEFFKPEKGRYLHPQMNRALTHAEAALLQGFDDRHQWCGKKLEIARQIGNAVPPPLALAIAHRVKQRLTRASTIATGA
jgi:DNA (cytosine-5)-methyltransferase 1